MDDLFPLEDIIIRSNFIGPVRDSENWQNKREETHQNNSIWTRLGRLPDRKRPKERRGLGTSAGSSSQLVLRIGRVGVVASIECCSCIWRFNFHSSGNVTLGYYLSTLWGLARERGHVLTSGLAHWRRNDVDAVAQWVPETHERAHDLTVCFCSISSSSRTVTSCCAVIRACTLYITQYQDLTTHVRCHPNMPRLLIWQHTVTLHATSDIAP